MLKKVLGRNEETGERKYREENYLKVNCNALQRYNF